MVTAAVVAAAASNRGDRSDEIAFRRSHRAFGFDDLPLFASAPKPMTQEPGPLDRVLAALVALNPDEMSPREAIEALLPAQRQLDAEAII